MYPALPLYPLQSAQKPPYTENRRIGIKRYTACRMATFQIEFEWWRDAAGYEYVPPEAPGALGRIRRKGGPVRWYRPLDFHPGLFQQFAELSRDVDWTRLYSEDERREAIARVLKFVEAFGFICQRPNPVDPEWLDEFAGCYDVPEAEAVDDIFVLSDDMAANIDAWQDSPRALLDLDDGPWLREPRPGEAWISDISAVLRPVPPDGRLGLRLIPETLYDAMKLQFAQMVASGAAVRACKFCGTWFEAGTGSRRADAKFCSTRCKIRFHNARKLKGASK
jgi:hypothetical protein